MWLNFKMMTGSRDGAQRYSTCLESVRSYILFPVPQRKKKAIEKDDKYSGSLKKELLGIRMEGKISVNQ